MNVVLGESPARRIQVAQKASRNLGLPHFKKRIKFTQGENIMAANMRVRVLHIVGGSCVAAILAGTVGVASAEAVPQTPNAAVSVVQGGDNDFNEQKNRIKGSGNDFNEQKNRIKGNGNDFNTQENSIEGNDNDGNTQSNSIG
ncbi:hypothetical protein [Streptomyces sp. HC307]|uniref:hypothetical protein n=1 Tax=Streptomyces flavusporus TaxID=3385496 RepID=UPI003916D855